MLETNLVSQEILQDLNEKGIDSWQAVLKAGKPGLTAVDGIGPVTAEKLLQAARGLLPIQDGPVASEIPNEEEVPLEQEQLEPGEPEEAPEPRSRFVEVRMVKYPVAIVGAHRMVPGDVQRVHVQRYLEALAKYPKGTFVVRYVGELEYRESL